MSEKGTTKQLSKCKLSLHFVSFSVADKFEPKIRTSKSVPEYHVHIPAQGLTS